MSSDLIIVISQLNLTVGDIIGNTNKIIAAAQQARDEKHAHIVVFPELALSGYPPEDLVLRNDFIQSIQHALHKVAHSVQNILIIVGYPERTELGIYNSAAVLLNGQQIANHRKQKLPNYGVFDEKRYFILGTEPTIVNYKNINIAVTICEDVWFPEPIAQAAEAGAQLIISVNASPYDYLKPEMRVKVLKNRIQESKLPIIYANLVGGQDDLFFDGNSLALNQNGEICAHGKFAEEQLLAVTIDKNLNIIPQAIPPELSLDAQIYQGLVVATRDYIIKNGFQKVLIGLSGGIDSALTCAIAVDALGKENVSALLLPSRYTAKESITLAEELANNLKIHYQIISIEPTFKSFLRSLKIDAKETPHTLTAQNIQARCRAILLMALSNEHNQLVLNTSNKSEMAVGYSTLYGDMAGAYAVLKDVFKTEVFRLAKYRNSISPIIPEAIINRVPTAELAPGQKDEDNIPPYPILDSILTRYIEADQSIDEMIAAGFDEKTIKLTVDLVSKTEYKRRQAPPGPRISPRAFGRERRFPITSKFWRA